MHSELVSRLCTHHGSNLVLSVKTILFHKISFYYKNNNIDFKGLFFKTPQNKILINIILD